MDDLAARLERVHAVGGCLGRSLLAAGAGLWLLVSLVVSWSSSAGAYGVLGVVVAAAVAAGALVRDARLGRWTVAAAVTSLLFSSVLATAGDSDAGLIPSLPLEGLALLVLLARVAWRSPRNRIVPLEVLLGSAVVLISIRFSLAGLVFFAAPLAVSGAAAIGLGIYLRALETRRTRVLDEARRDERLELARDLHDFVAHHVTGIVVQAQAARFTAGTEVGHDPERLDAMFADIERAGTEALTSMRRMIGLLRNPGEDRPGGIAQPVGDLVPVADLVAGFSHPPATLEIDPGVGALPPEVTTSVHRIVQEALTNTRKHAADATGVRVTVRRPMASALEVAVRDDGRGRGRLLPGGGFGLAGLRERVDVLGGTLRAGPRPEGGWEVLAVIPIPETPRTINP